MSKIIDFHSHVFPQETAGEIVSKMKKRTGVPNVICGGPKELFQSIEEANIEISVILPVCTNPDKADTINSFAASLTSHPRIVSFGSVHPLQKNWREAIKGFRAQGIKGLKIHNDYQEYMFNSRICMDIISAAYEEGLMVLAHTGTDPVSPNFTRCTPEMLRDAMPLLRQGVFIAAHLGGLMRLEEAKRYVFGSDIYIDTSMMSVYYPLDHCKEALLSHNPDKILFGSDSPWGCPKTFADEIRGMELGAELTEKILYKNAKNLLDNQA